ncbi:MAG: CapA family protein [Actinobacteria bacterium]|nr:CapA family protein [Actinomycetota bacterium]
MAGGRHRGGSSRSGFGLRLALVLLAAAAALAAGAGWYLGRAGGRSDPSPAAAVEPATDPSPSGPPSPTAEPSPEEPVEEAEAPDPKARRFTIAATGDILIHASVWQQAARYGAGSGVAFDFRPMFRPIRPLILSADLAVCHLETPVTPDHAALSSFPVFNVPAEVVEAIAWTGYDTCSTASNHSLDRGVAGISATLGALDEAGVAHAGTARTRKESRRPTLLEVQGVTVAQLSYAYGFNGFVPPADTPWVVNGIDPERIVADARRAREAGAEFVVVSLHWGTQYVTAPTAEQRRVADALTRSPAVDLILGHHAHVVQPVQVVGKKYVVFGLGNLLSNMTSSCDGCTAAVQDGVIVHLEVAERGKRFRVTRVRYTPTWVEQGTTWRILPVARLLDRKDVPAALRALLGASWNRTVRALNLLGANTLGVIPDRIPRDPVPT